MHLLGVHIPDTKLIKIALLQWYGVGLPTAERILARLQIHDRTVVADLTDGQINALSAFLSAPNTTPPPPKEPRASLRYEPVQLTMPAPPPERSGKEDKLSQIKLEAELRREMRENIAHHRDIGTYVGRRHSMHLPVRGQRTNRNSKTARKLNRIERRSMSTGASFYPFPSLSSSAALPIPPLISLLRCRRPDL